jgi:hypothetical protein
LLTFSVDQEGAAEVPGITRRGAGQDAQEAPRCLRRPDDGTLPGRPGGGRRVTPGRRGRRT